ncbi:MULTISPECIES: alpha-D-glucose phosphate-specific phosphoglucomutase [unclassified Yoonia]|uniref:alpha-D-glucose phosphate-specific phosphoglucomutase n=1 Tax=unclassified Yoonia TaxID=2629118 RepID=UPI002AFF8555|nr:MULTISPECIES: alpha-D-glucose phosphate-specific phosphoglucomutase [unclassified Yoonia]
MHIRDIPTAPIDGQKAGTSGLRRRTRDYMAPLFLENYVQAIIDGTGGATGKTYVVGGDGRYFNDTAIQIILRILAGNGAARVIVGQGGLLSTPAASHLIRKMAADSGFILSASHNPGGIDADFGLKYNMANGGPATETVTAAIFAASAAITRIRMAESADIDLQSSGTARIGAMQVDVIDPVTDYLALMEELFDLDAIARLFAGGFRMRFDAMHAVTGPYARAVLVERCGAAPDSVMNATPLPDFGGGHPDPNPIWAHELMAVMTGPDAPDFGAASDGDGDRNMIVGRGQYVTPSDSLALIADQAHLARGYARGLTGVARSMPTSSAVDRVAAAKGIPCFETPTGWKFFGNLLDTGQITLCGEESAGTGSDHIREKDGLWAVLMWLNIIAVSGRSVADLMAAHWQAYGRNYYSRHDYEEVESDIANALMDDLRGRLPDLPGQSFAGMKITAADDFAYDDPVDGSRSEHQGLRLYFEGEARAVLRLSGTGTSGATLRVYLEQIVTAPGDLHQDAGDVLSPLAAAVDAVAGIAQRTGRNAPDVTT